MRREGKTVTSAAHLLLFLSTSRFLASGRAVGIVFSLLFHLGLSENSPTPATKGADNHH